MLDAHPQRGAGAPRPHRDARSAAQAAHRRDPQERRLHRRRPRERRRRPARRSPSCSSTAATARAPSTASAASRAPAAASTSATTASRASSRGLGISILSTSRGVMSDRKRAARRSAASSSARSGDRDAPHRSRPSSLLRADASVARRQAPDRAARRASRSTVNGRQDRREGPEGHSSRARSPPNVDVKIDGGKLAVSSDRRRPRRLALPGPRPRARRGMVEGRRRRLHEDARARRHRLPRRAEGHDPELRARLLAPRSSSRFPTGIKARSRPTPRARSSSSPAPTRS